MKNVFYMLLFVLLFNACSEDESPTSPANNNDPLLIGTWDLTSVIGQSLPTGVFLRWAITENTVTITSDLDCIEVISYEAVDGKLRGLALISQEGSQCGDGSGDSELGSYTVNQMTLTVTITDPDLIPPTATFVFTKI